MKTLRWMAASAARIAVAGFVLVGCAERAPDRTDDRASATPTPTQASAAASKRSFGAAITETATTPLADLTKEPAKFASKTVRTEGKVVAVCKKMGCWMEIGDANGQVHVRMAGHGFFVPKDSDGHRAVVQGTVVAGAASNNCEDGDGCRGEAQKQTGRVASVELEASGVELVD